MTSTEKKKPEELLCTLAAVRQPYKTQTQTHKPSERQMKNRYQKFDATINQFMLRNMDSLDYLR